MNSNLNRLLASLQELMSFFELVPGHPWIDTLNDIFAKISAEQTREDGLQLLNAYFGGMGTLNDYFFSKHNRNVPIGYTEEEANKKYEVLLDSVYTNLKLLQGNFLHRAFWKLLQFRYRKNLSPRILNAFERK